jgi:hypothetical protein
VTLGISESTVNWHLANAFERLGASSRAEAVALAIRSDGAEVVGEAGRVPPAPAPARASWPRLVAIAIAIAIAGALLGGATVATLRLGPGPFESPTATPTSGTHQNVLGGDIVPIGGASRPVLRSPNPTRYTPRRSSPN